MLISKNLRVKLSLGIGLIATASVILWYASNVQMFWCIWFIAVGLFLGVSLTENRRIAMLCSLCLLSIAGFVALHIAPIHSLGWGHIRQVVVLSMDSEQMCVITDPARLKTLESFGKRGSYSTMLKCGRTYLLRVSDGLMEKLYYVHGGVIGDKPGGFVQTVFVPTIKGLEGWIEENSLTRK